MYTNIGKKIKVMAVVFAAVGIIASIIAGIVLIVGDYAGIGVPVLFGGAFLSWVSSFLVYGFGQLVENSDLLVKEIRKKQGKAEKKALQRMKEIERLEKKREMDQLIVNLQDDSVEETEYMDFHCPLCGETVSYTKGYIQSNVTLSCPNCNRSFRTDSIFDA